MILNTIVTTNTEAELKINFQLVGIPFESQYKEYVVVIYNQSNEQVEKNVHIKNSSIEGIAKDIREYLNKFNPLKIEVAYSGITKQFEDVDFVTIDLILKKV